MAKQDDFIRTALRVPPDLHKQLHEAASVAGRTFNAEIVQRLEQSFEHTHTAYVQAGPPEGRAFIELMTSNMQSHAEMLTLRLALAKMRMQAEVDRLEKLSAEIDQETKAAQTDEDFARLEEKIAKLTSNKATLREIETELHAIVGARELLLTQLQNGLELVEGARESAEARLRTVPVIADLDAGSGTYIEAAHNVLTKRGLKSPKRP